MFKDVRGLVIVTIETSNKCISFGNICGLTAATNSLRNVVKGNFWYLYKPTTVWTELTVCSFINTISAEFEEQRMGYGCITDYFDETYIMEP